MNPIIDAPIRTDTVAIKPFVDLGARPSKRSSLTTICANMTLEPTRIKLSPIATDNRFRVWLRWYFSRRSMFPASIHRVIDFADVRKVWTWRPELSDWPMLEIGSRGDNLLRFHLLAGTYPRLALAAVDDVREHVGAIEEARRRASQSTALQPSTLASQ